MSTFPRLTRSRHSSACRSGRWRWETADIQRWSATSGAVMPSDTSGVGRERAPARLAVRLLGAVEIILDGRRLRAINSLRLQRFLALIALRRDPQHRSRLAFELWP